MIYLDNSATTHHKPTNVIKESCLGLKKYSINPGRSGYSLAIETQEKVFECREKLSTFLGTTPENVIFTSGCTMAINLGLMGTAKKNGHIITTTFEHNSVTRTLEKLKSTHNITYSVIYPNKNGQITSNEISKHIRNNTYMIIVNHTSNVTGVTQNIESIGKLCKKHNILFFVDGAQSIGHEKINMQEQNINLLSLAGHKGLYAPQGIGALLINNCKVEPLIYGGTGTHSDKIKQPTDYPEGLESGTQNIIGILGLSAGIDFVTTNQEKINTKVSSLTKYLIEGLNRIKYVEVYSGNINSGVVSFTIKNKDSSTVSNILNQDFGICTRSGLHCAYLTHKYYKTLKNGMTRISLSCFNKLSEIKKTIEAVEKIALYY
jgi:cysteine desulfurase family protein